MANRKISTLPDAAVLGDLVGTQVSILDDLVAAKTKQVTLALLRRALFAGGTGYTASDALQAGNTTITGTLNVSGAATVGGALSVTGALTVGRIAGSSLALGTDASGTNAAATDFTQTAPLSTGDATPAALVWQVGVQGSSGSTPQTLTEGFRVQEVATESSRQIVAWNPNGSFVSNIPTSASSEVLGNGLGGTFGVQFRVLRAASNPAIIVGRVNTSFAAPSGVTSGQIVGGFEGRGWSSGTARLVQLALMNIVARENITDSARGGMYRFQAVDIGDTTLKNIIDLRGGGTNIAELVSGQPTLRLIPGATQFAIRDSGNTADTFTVNAAGTAITAPLATSFVVGADPGGSALGRFGGALRATSITLDSGIIQRATANAILALTGGNASNVGGVVFLYGQSHATQANDIEFRSGTNVRGWWDDSASLWEFSNAASTLTRFSTPAAGETSLWLYDADNATLERVTVGAADSGGVGFKVLRIPN